MHISLVMRPRYPVQLLLRIRYYVCLTYLVSTHQTRTCGCTISETTALLFFSFFPCTITVLFRLAITTNNPNDGNDDDHQS